MKNSLKIKTRIAFNFTDWNLLNFVATVTTNNPAQAQVSNQQCKY